jgi:hypothetical protein
MATKGYMVHYITFLKYMLPFSKKYFRLLYFHEISLYIVETCLYKCLDSCPPTPPQKRGGRRILAKILGLGHKSQLTPIDLCPP